MGAMGEMCVMSNEDSLLSCICLSTPSSGQNFSNPCQKMHLQKHHCLPFIIHEEERCGRMLIAARDIRAGEVLFSDTPGAVAPVGNSKSFCLGCYKKLEDVVEDEDGEDVDEDSEDVDEDDEDVDEDSEDEDDKDVDSEDVDADGKDVDEYGMYRCSQCTWPLCNPTCETGLHARECQLFQINSTKFNTDNYKVNNSAYNAIMVLRVLWMKEHDPGTWEKINMLMDHNEAKESTSKTRHPSLEVNREDVIDIFPVHL